jgi:hypothetical protein
MCPQICWKTPTMKCKWVDELPRFSNAAVQSKDPLLCGMRLTRMDVQFQSVKAAVLN